MIAAVADLLRCPHCAQSLRREPLRGSPASLICPTGHRYDEARQGHVTLLPPRGTAMRGDTSQMVQARVDVQQSGWFSPITDVLVEAATALLDDDSAGAIVDVGAGTGHHLAALLDASPERLGVALDISPAAARRAAKAHPRLGSVVADARQDLPVGDGVAALALVAFAPRSSDALHRILAADGALVVLTPTTRHLTELVTEFGLLAVGEDKQQRLDALLQGRFTILGHSEHEGSSTVSAPQAAALVRMGPSAWHTSPEQVASMVGDHTREVTWSVRVSRYRPIA